MEFISIGPNCSSSELLKSQNLKKKSYPFDSIFSSLEIIKHCIDDKFKTFLDKAHYTPGICESSTRHDIYCKYLDTDVLIEHHRINGFNSLHPADHKISSGNLFNHHDLINNEDHYEAFKRRADRLLTLIENGTKIVFVYYDMYTENYQELIEFSKHFSAFPNIYILGIFENKGERKILYESESCKLYQNMHHSYIFGDISDLIDKEAEE
jgi:hypothetical protein